MIGILNYGLGNLLSVFNALEFLDGKPEFVSDGANLARVDGLVIPGVGHFGKGMQALEALGLVEPLNEEVIVRRKPVLGICLGMQLMCAYSEEAGRKGLGWFDERVRLLNSKELRTPNIGWSEVSITGGRMRDVLLCSQLLCRRRCSRCDFLHKFGCKSGRFP